jgi:hypothetical protein
MPSLPTQPLGSVAPFNRSVSERGIERPDDDDDEFLTLAEFAKWARFSTRTLQRLLSIGDGPPVIHLSERRKIVSKNAARSWLVSRTKNKAPSEPKPCRRGRPRKLPDAQDPAP